MITAERRAEVEREFREKWATLNGNSMFVWLISQIEKAEVEKEKEIERLTSIVNGYRQVIDIKEPK